MNLTLGQSPEGIAQSAISPLREMGAYEALWAKPGATFKTIADKFQKYRARTGHDALPSDFVGPNESYEFAARARQIIAAAGARDIGVRVHGAGEYPGKLRDARYPAELLYFRGRWELIEQPSIAIVGARKASEEGVRRARRLAKCLVDAGYVVASGLAKGIDTAAHTATLEAGGSTIAVIGTPLSEAYPKDNRELQEKLAREHLIVSPVPFVRYSQQDWRVNRGFFPERNAVMSALTDGTIIVEASDTSGTLTQARAALYQGRKLFILESCFQRPGLKWPHMYERRGAIRVRDFEDIREVLARAPTEDRRSDEARPLSPAGE